MANIVDILLKVEDKATEDIDKLSNTLETDFVNSAKKSNQQIIEAFERMGEFSKQNVTKTKVSMESVLSEVKDFSGRVASNVSDVTGAVEKDFKKLGIRSEKSITDARKDIIKSFQNIKKSGVASSKDISKAYKAMNRQLKELDGVKDLKNEFNDAGKRGNKFADILQIDTKTAITAVGVGAVAAGKQLFDMTKELSDSAAELVSLSEQTGFSTRTIQGLSAAATANSVDVKDMRDGLRDLNFEIGDAAATGGIIEKKFKDIGISVKDASGNLKSSEVVFNELADAVSRIEDPAQRAAAVARLLGEDNQKLIPVLLEGSQALGQYANELDRTGQLMDEDMVQRLAGMQEGFRKIEASTQSAKITLVDAFGDDLTNAILNVSEGIGQLFSKDAELVKINAQLAKSEQVLTEALGGRIATTKEGLKLSAQNEEQLKKQKKETEAATKETIKFEAELSKLQSKFKEELALEGLNDTEKALKKNNDELQEMITKYGIKLPEAIEVFGNREKKILDESARNQKKFNDSLQDELDLSKAGQALSETEATQLRRGVERRGVTEDIAERRRKAEKEGLDTSQLDELERLKLQELEDSFSDADAEIRKAKKSMDNLSESSDETEESTKSLSESIEEIGESSEKAAGGLAQALSGMDAIGARAFEFMGAGQRTTGASAFGTAGVANDVESLLLVADRARAEALRELISKGQTGQVDFGAEKLAQMIEEFNKLSEQLGGLGTIRGGSGRSGALLGSQEITLKFEPSEDIDNLSVESQRQIAEQTANIIGGSVG